MQAAAASGQDSGSHAQAVSIVVTVLVFALVITVLVVAYYRRRMRRMQEDLKNRSVLYIENTVLSPNSGLGQGEVEEALEYHRIVFPVGSRKCNVSSIKHSPVFVRENHW